jgi:DMSO/TMAO reductase YedYZ molybdopterin-dependent catalytic subunit
MKIWNVFHGKIMCISVSVRPIPGMEWAGAQLNGAQFTHGMIHNMEYTGVPLRLLLQEAGYDTSGKWVFVEGADASSNGRSIPMEKALDDVLVAFKANGEALRKEHGYPVRLVVPGWEGNMWVKWIRRIEVTNEPVESREETSKYTDTLEDGTSRKWTWAMDAKSVVTSPSPQGSHHPWPRSFGDHWARLVWKWGHHPCGCVQRRGQNLGNRALGQAWRENGAHPLLSGCRLGWF